MSNHDTLSHVQNRLKSLSDNERQAWLIALLIIIGVVGVFTLAGVNEANGFFQPRHPWGPDLTLMRIGLVAIGGVSGFCLGWLFSSHGRLLKLTIALGLAGIAGSIVIFDHGALGWGSAWLLAFVGFLAGLGYWTRRFVERIRELPTTLGSARWATIREMMEGELFSGDGFLLGRALVGPDEHQRITYPGDGHLLTIAPSRSGKGTNVIVPILLTYEGPVLVTDPKGENTMITAEHRRDRMGQKVHVVDPWGITGLEPSRFNPMDWLQAGDVDIGDNAMLLADAIVEMAGGDAKYFDEESLGLFPGLMVYVAIDPAEEGRRTFGRVRDLMLLDGDDLRELFTRMLNSPHPMVRSTGARCLQKEEKLLSNVWATLQSHTHFLDSPRIRESLSASDFDFADMKTKPMTIYLAIPGDRLKSHGRFLRLLIQQALTVNARNIEAKPDKNVLFLIDEMPALGRLSAIEQAYGLMAGYGMQLHGICQNLSQLKAAYGDGFETFIANSGMVQYFGSGDNMTSEYFSKLCGVTTVWNASTALARAAGITRGKETSHSDSTTHTDTATGTQRQLIYADELRRLPEDKQLLLIGNMNPIIADRHPWFRDDDLKQLGRNLHAEAAAAKATAT